MGGRDAAAHEKGPFPAQEVDAVSGTRPFASAIKDRIGAGWAELLAGRTSPADILNVIFALAETALDKRQPQAVAERAAMRLWAGLRHSSYLKSLAGESQTQALQTYSSELQSEHPDLVTRFLDEEATKDRSLGASGRVAVPRATTRTSGQTQLQPVMLTVPSSIACCEV